MEFLNILKTKVQKAGRNVLILTGILLITAFCKSISYPEYIKISENLQITKLNDQSFIHTSYIPLKNGTKFPCNGFIYLDKNEAFIFDSPVTDMATAQLIKWLQNDMKITIRGVIFNHFHNDCTEGIDIFRKMNIKTIASKLTADLMLKEGYLNPDTTFENSLELKLGKKIVLNTFMGEAHSKDNIISYFPNERILFGGCMVKSLTAKKGNLADANVSEWPHTVARIKNAYPDLQIVIPGHGSYGDASLLEYTISLFKN